MVYAISLLACTAILEHVRNVVTVEGLNAISCDGKSHSTPLGLGAGKIHIIGPVAVDVVGLDSIDLVSRMVSNHLT